MYRRNAFRVLELRTTTSLRDATKELERRRMLLELGQVDDGTRGRIGLKPPPSIEDLRAAEAALHDPEQRLLHELFWFWPLDSNSEEPDAALNALQVGDLKTAMGYWDYARKSGSSTTSRAVIAKHNLAVRWHLYVLDLETLTQGRCWLDEQADTIRKSWAVALKHWQECIQKDVIWNALSARAIAMNDERLSLDFVQDVRESVDAALLKINSTLALRYAEGALESASKIQIALINESPLLAGNEKVLDEYIIGPAKARTRQAIDAAEKSRTTDPKSGAAHAIGLLGSLSMYQPLLSGLDTIGLRHDVLGLYDEVAEQCLKSVLSFHAATDDSSTAITTLARVLPLARTEALRTKIETNIAIGRSNLAFERMAVLLDPLVAVEESKASPKERLAEFLRTVEPMISKVSEILAESAEIKAKIANRLSKVLRDISVDAWNGQKDGVTAFDALARAESYALSVELKKKLAEDRATLTIVYAEQRRTLQAQRLNKYGWGIGIALAVAFIVAMAVSNPYPSRPPSVPSANAPPAGRAPTTAEQSAAPAAEPTYRIPRYISSELERDKAAAEAAKQEAATLAKQLQDLNQQVEGRKREAQQAKDALDTLRFSIDQERAFVSETDDVAIQAFNSKVSQYNALLKRTHQLMKRADELVDPYNALLGQVQAKQQEADRLVDAYNAKLLQYGRR